MASSISAPLKSVEAAAKTGKSKFSGNRPRRPMCTLKISARSGSAGRSTKKISSRRPLRSNSAGKCEMSLAVATTNTGAFFSLNQVRKVPKTRAAVPPSLEPLPWEPEKALSISSTHKIAGATDSATAMARRTFSSDEPTRLPNIRPMSKRSSGSCHWLEIALAQRLLPHPCTPSSSTPLGNGKPNIRASGEKADDRLTSQSLRMVRPPTLLKFSVVA